MNILRYFLPAFKLRGKKEKKGQKRKKLTHESIWDSLCNIVQTDFFLGDLFTGTSNTKKLLKKVLDSGIVWHVRQVYF